MGIVDFSAHQKKSAWLLRPDTLFYAFFVTIQSPISIPLRCISMWLFAI